MVDTSRIERTKPDLAPLTRGRGFGRGLLLRQRLHRYLYSFLQPFPSASGSNLE